ncbi:hypothetical protein, partial [Burkholderia multivorans]|uniref:hypothetical protein n=1 Tax=Burkholderia multivorans TaxID=87883 RepID=UPI001C25D0A6
EVRPEYERNSPRMSSNSYVNLKIATCLVRYADDRLIDQRFPKETFPVIEVTAGTRVTWILKQALTLKRKTPPKDQR